MAIYKIKTRLTKEFMSKSNKIRHSCGGRYHTKEWSVYNVDGNTLNYLKKAEWPLLPGVTVLEVEELSAKNDTTDKNKLDKPIKKKLINRLETTGTTNKTNKSARNMTMESN